MEYTLMKLYNLDRGDKFKLAGDDNSPVFEFDHLDGMYSVCYSLDPYDYRDIIHFAGFTPVIRVKENG